jgi:2-dehydro-3-deoxy-D-gluconate 5-dehydrogenase
MDLKLSGRVAIVTGASKGIGRAIAEGLAAEGVQVMAVARESDALRELAQHASGRIEVMDCDVTDRDTVLQLPERTVQRLGRLDIVVNNAGGAIMGQFLDQPWSNWDWHLAINLTAPAALSAAACRYFREQHSGKIINIASTAAVRGVDGLAAYCATKGALVQLTKALAMEWAAYGVQVNAIGPGAFATEANRPLWDGPEERMQMVTAGIPDGRMGRPEEVADLACFLASPVSDHITGELIMIDGGDTAGHLVAKQKRN